MRLLDIGWGTGGFLRYTCRYGFDVYGFDVYGFDSSLAQIVYAKQELLSVSQAFSPSEYLESLGKPELYFDLVTLGDVLEHIRNPLEFLSSVHVILRPGGLLFVSTPNGWAMLWKRRVYSLFGKRHDYDWVPWEHVFYYTSKSLVYYLNRTNFLVLRSGAVACYRRPLSAFELVRRLVFLVTAGLPSWAPQIYTWSYKTAQSD